MFSLQKRTEEIYSDLTCGKRLTPETSELLNALSIALEERLNNMVMGPGLTREQWNFINMHTSTGNLGCPPAPTFPNFSDLKVNPPDNE